MLRNLQTKIARGKSQILGNVQYEYAVYSTDKERVTDVFRGAEYRESRGWFWRQGPAQDGEQVRVDEKGHWERARQTVDAALAGCVEGFVSDIAF